MSTGWTISCDTGTDDALALGVAVAHPAVDLRAVVASAGNAQLSDVVANTAAVLGLMGWSGPFGIGDEVSLRGDAPGRAGHVHGDDGMLGKRAGLPAGPVAQPDGVALMTGAVLAVGPLTTVARALEAGAPIERVVWMGGGLDHGNVTSFAEFNAWWDPLAADRVFQAGVPLRVVPLDVTEQVRITPSDVARLEAAGTVPAFFGDLERDSHTGMRAALHDPVAVLAAAEPERFTWQPMTLRCQLDGEAIGRTVGQPIDGGSVEVAVDADHDALRQRVIDLLASLT